jgi:hypothetical protein
MLSIDYYLMQNATSLLLCLKIVIKLFGWSIVYY